jgi:small subunit ribosomal protein S17
MATKSKSEDVTGMGIEKPTAACTDGNCPFHGKLRLHGKHLTGVITSARMRRTANILIERTDYITKYERSERKRSRVKAHNPECISAKDGDKVEIVECRPLSKTKHFVIVRKV